VTTRWGVAGIVVDPNWWLMVTGKLPPADGEVAGVIDSGLADAEQPAAVRATSAARAASVRREK